MFDAFLLTRKQSFLQIHYREQLVLENPMYLGIWHTEKFEIYCITSFTIRWNFDIFVFGNFVI